MSRKVKMREKLIRARVKFSFKKNDEKTYNRVKAPSQVAKTRKITGPGVLRVIKYIKRIRRNSR